MARWIPAASVSRSLTESRSAVMPRYTVSLAVRPDRDRDADLCAERRERVRVEHAPTAEEQTRVVRVSGRARGER